jgi:hypothetical protein
MTAASPRSGRVGNSNMSGGARQPDRNTLVKNRQAAHDAATTAWAEAGGDARSRRARTAGLAEMARGRGRPARTAEQRRALQQQHKERLQAIWLRSLKDSQEGARWDPRRLDRSQYFPHQSTRERTRRIARVSA